MASVLRLSLITPEEVTPQVGERMGHPNQVPNENVSITKEQQEAHLRAVWDAAELALGAEATVEPVVDETEPTTNLKIIKGQE